MPQARASVLASVLELGSESVPTWPLASVTARVLVLGLGSESVSTWPWVPVSELVLGLTWASEWTRKRRLASVATSASKSPSGQLGRRPRATRSP